MRGPEWGGGYPGPLGWVRQEGRGFFPLKKSLNCGKIKHNIKVSNLGLARLSSIEDCPLPLQGGQVPGQGTKIQNAHGAAKKRKTKTKITILTIFKAQFSSAKYLH